MLIVNKSSVYHSSPLLTSSSSVLYVLLHFYTSFFTSLSSTFPYYCSYQDSYSSFSFHLSTFSISNHSFYLFFTSLQPLPLSSIPTSHQAICSLLQAGGVPLWLVSRYRLLRRETCTHYIFLVSDPGRLLRLLWQLHQDSLHLLAKIVLVTHLRPRHLLHFLQVKRSLFLHKNKQIRVLLGYGRVLVILSPMIRNTLLSSFEAKEALFVRDKEPIQINPSSYCLQ